MKKTILEIYALAVCFASVVSFVIASGIAIYNVIEIAVPQITINSFEYDRHQSNDEYWKSISINEGDRPAKKEMKRPSEQELTKQRIDSYYYALREVKRSAVQSIIKAGIVIFLNIVFFIIHWHIAVRARETSINT